jgi:hypothetical protein
MGSGLAARGHMWVELSLDLQSRKTLDNREVIKKGVPARLAPAARACAADAQVAAILRAERVGALFVEGARALLLLRGLLQVKVILVVAIVFVRTVLLLVLVGLVAVILVLLVLLHLLLLAVLSLVLRFPQVLLLLLLLLLLRLLLLLLLQNVVCVCMFVCVCVCVCARARVLVCAFI